MAIWHAAPKALLSVLLESTDHKYYAGELCELTGLTKPTVYKVLNALAAAGLLKKQPESHNSAGAARIYYSVTEKGVTVFRLSA